MKRSEKLREEIFNLQEALKMIGGPGWSFFLSDLISEWEREPYRQWKKIPPTDASVISQLQINAKNADLVMDWANQLKKRLSTRNIELKEILEGEQEDTVYPTVYTWQTDTLFPEDQIAIDEEKLNKQSR